MRDHPQIRDEFHWELAAEAITVRIRWFGLCMGYVLVDLLQRAPQNRPTMNSILALGAVYALLDTFWSLKGRVFMGRWPLLVSVMEALFIGLLCQFDAGLESPFRFYYFLSLLVCAIRNSPAVTYATFALHAVSLCSLAWARGATSEDALASWLLMLVIMGWVTWASTSLVELLKKAGQRTLVLNAVLKENQALLEERIQERTRELQESQALLVQNEKQAAFGLLAAGIAHEVGNPLAAISSLVQMLNRRHPDEYTREKLQLVGDQLSRIQGILRELVDFSRPANKERSKCDIHEVIDAALNITKYYKRYKGKQIVRSYATDLPRVRVMRDQLVQVFLNLILNSMDATDEGGTIEISTNLEDKLLKITFRDDGSGIPLEDQQRIYQPYFTTKPTGTGLGLFVCQNIMDQMLGGKIELVRSSAEGTTFLVTLPVDDLPAAVDPPSPSPAETIPSEVGTC
ncbi:MAG: ATP-binding protein [Planctomycetales bacterium]